MQIDSKTKVIKALPPEAKIIKMVVFGWLFDSDDMKITAQ